MSESSLQVEPWYETYEVGQPWVVYTYGLTHDKWWPFWNSTRFLGRARIQCECAICGKKEIVSIPIPRFGPVPEPKSGRHPERERFLAEYQHPHQRDPIKWAQPLRNPAALEGTGRDFLSVIGERVGPLEKWKADVRQRSFDDAADRVRRRFPKSPGGGKA